MSDDLKQPNPNEFVPSLATAGTGNNCICSARGIDLEYHECIPSLKQKLRLAQEEVERVKAQVGHGSLTCTMCGLPVLFEFTVASDIWNRIVRSQGIGEYLCVWCFSKMVPDNEHVPIGVNIGLDRVHSAWCGLDVPGAYTEPHPLLAAKDAELRAKTRECEELKAKVNFESTAMQSAEINTLLEENTGLHDELTDLKRQLDTALRANSGIPALESKLAELQALPDTIIAQADELEELRDEKAELTRKGKELCCAYGNALVTIHDKEQQLSNYQALMTALYDALGIEANEASVLERVREVIAQVAGMRKQPRFENVSCSNCGQDFGPGDHGFSHCEDHQPTRTITREERLADELANEADIKISDYGKENV